MKIKFMVKVFFRLNFVAFSILVLTLPLAATAQDNPPLRGSMVGANDGDLLDFECVEVSMEKVECSFVQVLLTLKSSQKEFEESLESIPDILEEMTTEVELCESIIAYDKVRNGQLIKDPILADKIKRAIEERSASSMKDHRSLEKVNFIDKAMLNLCTDPSKETAREFLAVTHELGSDVCEPMFNRYSQKFVRVSASLWVVESSPAGECGIINTSRLLADPKHPFLWNYEASKIITNKAGGGMIPCSSLDETPQQYFWNQGPVLKNCTYID